MGKVVGVLLVVLIVLVGVGCSESDETPIEAGTPVSPVLDDKNLSVHFLSVGHGDAILLTHSDTCILIDCGEMKMGPMVSSYLKDQGVSTIDLVVVTHPHDDHADGLAAILNDFEVKEILDCGESEDSNVYERFSESIDKHDVPCNVAVRGQTIDLDPDLKIEVLSPPSNHFKGMNDNSVVLKVTYGQASFLFMGDVEDDAEGDLISSGIDLDSDVLKVGHHGNTTSTTQDLLNEVTPIISVIEAGPDDYGYPSPEILSRLENVGSRVYRTDVHGNIIITTDGSEYSIITQDKSSQVISNTTIIAPQSTSILTT